MLKVKPGEPVHSANAQISHFDRFDFHFAIHYFVGNTLSHDPSLRSSRSSRYNGPVEPLSIFLARSAQRPKNPDCCVAAVVRVVRGEKMRFSGGGLMRIYIVVSLLGVLAACAQIPTQELSQYRQAFSQVQTASEDVLIDFAAAMDAAEKRKAQPVAPAANLAVFSTSLEYGGNKLPSAVEVRRNALRTIDKFNNVLTTLAEGKSVEAIQGTASGFVEAAQKFISAAGGGAVPGLGALTGGLNTLIGEMEKARLRKEFEKIIRKGAPIIKAMLEELISERQEHMALRADEANLRQVDIVDDITTQAAAVRSLVREHDAPPADDPRQELQDELNSALKPVEKSLSLQLPIAIAYQRGKPPLGEDQAILARQLIGKISKSVGAFEANREAIESLRSALNNYGALLRQTQTTLDVLVENLNRPQSFEAASESFLGITFSLRSDLEAYKAARKGASQ